MSEISKWVLSIIGVTIIGVMIDSLTSSGKLSKYIKGIFSVFVVITILSPIVSLFKNNTFSLFTFNEYTPEIDYAFTENCIIEQKDYYENLIEQGLNSGGFSGVSVEIITNLSNSTFEVDKIILNTKNLVINQNMVHINKYTEMKNIVYHYISVEEENIIFDE